MIRCGYILNHMSSINPQDLPHYTYDDYCLWEGRWELIQGIPYAMTPAPSVDHQSISNKIAHQLTEALIDCEKCHALPPVDWKIVEDTIVQPDNLVICFPPEGIFITQAPAIIFEILSPSTANKDRHTKFKIYEREGVNYYVIVDPLDHIASIFRRVSGKFQKITETTNETVTFSIDECDVQFDFQKIF